MANEVSFFLALQTDSLDEGKIQCLSGKVMKWGEGLWLIDISSFYAFWLAQAVRQKTSVPSLWREVLNQSFGQAGTDIQLDYRAALASHPWRALLLLEAMEAGAQFGFMDGRSNLGKKLLTGLSWGQWFSALTSLSEVWEKQRLPRFNPARLRSQIARFTLAMTRLGMKKPIETKRLTQKTIQTRYGVYLSWAWSWTFARELDHHFPWQLFLFAEPPKVTRFLGEASFYWEPISLFLSQDLDQLCKSLGSKLVSSLLWAVTLEDMTEFIIPLTFRNPHDMKGELGHHQTVLLQAEAAMEAFFQSQKEVSLIPSLVVSWVIELDQCLTLPSLQYDIFGEALEEDSGELTLARLENQTPVALHRFALNSDWTPENSYQLWEGNEALEDASLAAAAQIRPLYLWKEPKEIEALDIEKLEFLESSMNQWWLPEQKNAHRQYFAEKKPDGSRWVFYDGTKKWFEHGIFA